MRAVRAAVEMKDRTRIASPWFPAMVISHDDEFRLLLSSVKDYAIYMLDPEGRIVTWNDGGREIKGYAAEEVIGKHFSLFFTPEDRARQLPQELLATAAREGRVESEGWRVRKDGSRFWADAILTALHSGKDRRLTGFAKVTRDLTERKRLEDRLRHSEENLSAALYSIGDAVLVTDAVGRVQRLNRVAEGLTGWSEPQAFGRPLHEVFRIINEHTRAPAPDPVARVLAEGVVVGLANHTTVIARDGRETPIADTAAPVRGPRDEIHGAVLVFRDISKERRAQEALQQSEEKLRLLVNSVRDYAIFLLNPEGRVSTWSPGAERIEGFREEEVLGTHVSRFFPPEDIAAGKPERELEEAARTGRFEDEGWRVRKDGTRFWANVVTSAIRDGGSGRLLGFAKVTRDLTERRRMEDERLRLLQAHEAIRLRDEFLRIASHELKTPMTALSLQLEALREQLETIDRPKLEARCRRAMQAGERLRMLIDTLLDASRITSGRLELQLGVFDLAAAVRDVVEQYRDVADKAGCTLTVTIDEVIHGRWDRLRIEQVIANLLSNAIRHGAGRSIEVVVRRNKDDSATMCVRDHGAGIPPVDLDRIFERFERASARSPHLAGVGLGLYVAREIAEAHGGTIAVANAEDGGARFTVNLPISAPPPTAARDERQERNHAGQVGAASRRIFIVDDDRDIRDTLTDALTDAGFVVDAAANGAEALQRLQEVPRPNVILLDLMMPVMDGFEFRRLQKLDPKLADIPVIVISAGGRADPNEIDADDHMAKPLRLHKLIAAVEPYLGRR